MNISCSGGGLPESGCMFFEVLGRSNITNGIANNNIISMSCNCHLIIIILQLSSTVLYQEHFMISLLDATSPNILV